MMYNIKKIFLSGIIKNIGFMPEMIIIIEIQFYKIQYYYCLLIKNQFTSGCCKFVFCE